MKHKTAVFFGIIYLLVFFVCPRCFAIVDTIAIDRVLEKNVLNDGDLRVIDEFMADAINEIVRTRDFATISKTRSIITTRTSKQGQYAQQFSESAHKHIQDALALSATLPGDRPYKVALNLLIVVDALKDPSLVDLAVGQLQHKSPAVRYWATRIAASDMIVNMINSNDEAARPLRVVNALQTQIENASPEILDLMAVFAGKIQTPEGQALLLSIADRRIGQYADWTVTGEQIDNDVLAGLCAKLKSQAGNKAQCAQRFAQLYSYVIQRYTKGFDTLDPDQKQKLASVIVDVESKCVTGLMGEAREGLRQAIERNDKLALMEEHDKLLGSRSAPGTLPELLRFSYGSDAAGSERKWPLALRNPVSLNAIG